MGPVGGYWSRHHRKSVGNRRGGRSDVVIKVWNGGYEWLLISRFR